ncbi:AfsA-related hotdog domain-containing protein [Streptomyces formicae]
MKDSTSPNARSAGVADGTATSGVESAGGLPTWRALGLETMASLLVLSLRRQGSRWFTAQCQWPRSHPLNERALTVRHHPLIMVESTRQLGVALAHRQLPGSGTSLLEPVSVSLGLRHPARPTERGSATEVEVRGSMSDHTVDADGLTGLRVTAEYLHAGRPFGSCVLRFGRPAPDRTPCPRAAPPSALLFPAAAAVGAAAGCDVMVARGLQGRLFISPRDIGHPVLLPGRPTRLPAHAVLEAGRQAGLLTSGMTAAAVVGLSVETRAPVPASGALIEVAAEPGGARFLVTDAGRAMATGTVALLRP